MQQFGTLHMVIRGQAAYLGVLSPPQEQRAVSVRNCFVREYASTLPLFEFKWCRISRWREAPSIMVSEASPSASLLKTEMRYMVCSLTGINS